MFLITFKFYKHVLPNMIALFVSVKCDPYIFYIHVYLYLIYDPHICFNEI